MSYRRARGHRTWHFCTNCRNWPLAEFDVSIELPRSGALCLRCYKFVKVHHAEFRLPSLSAPHEIESQAKQPRRGTKQHAPNADPSSNGK
jgi:hypothetical protein